MSPKWTSPKSAKKKTALGSFSSQEVLKDNFASKHQATVEAPRTIGLKGVLGLGQSVEIHRQTDNLNGWNQEFLIGLNYLQKQEQQLKEQDQAELQKEIENLLIEIKNLTRAAENLDSHLIAAVDAPIAEISQYQANFLHRLTVFISEIRQNVTEAAAWLQSFATKKRKKNFFWSMVQDKKKGGEQYLFSEESSVARVG